MKIVFFGSSDFAVRILEQLIKSNFEISAVITAPDQRKGRHLQLNFCPVKTFALEHRLLVRQPEDLNHNDTIDFLKKLAVDLFIVVSYGKILPKAILGIPEIFAINLHASLLPKYRGAAPINWAIIKGEKITGITIIKMNEYIDKGEIILREKIEITDTDTAVSLGEKLSKKGATLLIKCITDIKDNKFSLKPQETTEISYAPELKKSDGLIDWSKNASCLYNQIRGMIPWPGTFTYYQGRLLKIWKAEVCLLTNQASNYRVGQVINVSKDGIIVNCGKDSLEIKELQLEGKKRMRVSEFIIGYKIEVGDRLGYTSRST